MILSTLESRLSKDGDVYASILYFLAAIALAVSASSLSHVFDTASGIIWIVTDIAVVVLRFTKLSEFRRSLLFFGGSVLGSFAYFANGVLNSIMNIEMSLEFFSGAFQSFAASLFLFAGIAGLINLLRPGLTEVSGEGAVNLVKRAAQYSINNPGSFYLTASSINLCFALLQFLSEPGLASGGYIICAIFWLGAGFCIRFKYDKNRRPLVM